MLKEANRKTDDALGLIDELNGMLINVNSKLANEIQHIANLKTKLAEHMQCIAQQTNVLREFKRQMKQTLTSPRVHKIVIRAIDQLIKKLLTTNSTN